MFQYQARDHARAGGAAVGAAANCKADVVQAAGAVGTAVLATVLMLNAVPGEGGSGGRKGAGFSRRCQWWTWGMFSIAPIGL